MNGHRRAVLFACLLSGAGVMIVELTTTRLLAPWFGASIYAWTNVIAVVLLALACGYAAGGRIADKNPEPRVLGMLLLAAAVLLVPGPLLARFVAEALAPRPESSDPASGTLGVVAGSFAASLILFGPPLVILGCVTPFATRLLTDSGLTSGQAAGRTLAVSTLGSLVGTYLPALFLLELVGSRGTILIAAGVVVLAGVVLIGVRARGALLAVVVGAGLAGAGALCAATPIVPATRGETLIAEKESAYQYVRVARWPGEGGAPAAVNLSIDEGILEFHSRKRDGDRLTGAYYDFFAVLPDWIEGSDRDPVDALVIGGGAGTIRGMLRDLQGAKVDHVTDVEVDPAVAGFAPTFGGPATAKDSLAVMDGRLALASSDGPLDLVVLDAYARQIAIPAHLATREAFARVRARLSPRGIFAINVSAADVESPLCAALTATLREVFGNAWSVAVPGSWSIVLLAGRPRRPPPVAPDGKDPLDPVRRQFLRGFHQLAAVEAAVLTDDRAPLESLARRIR